MSHDANAHTAPITGAITRFPHAFVDSERYDFGGVNDGSPLNAWFGHSLKNVAELQIIHLVAAIREKPLWHSKALDKAVSARWRREAVALAACGARVDDRVVEFAFEELEYHRRLREMLPFERAAVDGTWMSDGLLTGQEVERFREAQAALEREAAAEKDWHPHSEMLVWDLVHPSLFPYMAGVSRISPAPAAAPLPPPLPLRACMGAGKEAPREFEHAAEPGVPVSFTSRRFQWLPSDVAIARDGTAKFQSYVNNLHPVDHAALYAALEPVFARFVPLFARVLEDLLCPLRRPVAMEMPEYPDHESDMSDLEFERVCEVREPTVTVGDFVPFDDDVAAAFGAHKGHADRAPSRRRVDLIGKTLQVIVKLANIELTPERPRYAGGAWHVEGCDNERVVATGIYYHSVCNITESRLEFRQAVNTPLAYEQGDEPGVRKVYGLHDNDLLHQRVGDIVAHEGRCIAFPNVYQHRVGPFALADPTRPGHRKVLVFFLVDPTQNVVSTASVPPQRADWFVRELRDAVVVPRCWLDCLEDEILLKIVAEMRFPLSMEQAKLHRLQLMEERKFVVDQNNAEVFERPFSLCEH